MMLLATNATRFGLNGQGALTARQALEAAGDGDRLTLEGLEVQARSLPDVLALAQNRVSVVALGVEDWPTMTMIATVGPGDETEATTEMISVIGPEAAMEISSTPSPGAVTDMMSATGPDGKAEATTTMIVAPDDPAPSTGTPGGPQQLAMW